MPDLTMARQTFSQRTNHHNRGWCQDGIQAACLGLRDEAARLVAIRAASINKNARFPALWGPNFDWVPDQDHGNNILTALQFMLVQPVEDKIFLMPSWPKTWDVKWYAFAYALHSENRGQKNPANIMPRYRGPAVVDDGLHKCSYFSAMPLVLTPVSLASGLPTLAKKQLPKIIDDPHTASAESLHTLLGKCLVPAGKIGNAGY